MKVLRVLWYRTGSSLLLRTAWHHSNPGLLQVAGHHLEGERIMLREPVIHYLIKVLKVDKTDFYTFRRLLPGCIQTSSNTSERQFPLGQWLLKFKRLLGPTGGL